MPINILHIIRVLIFNLVESQTKKTPKNSPESNPKRDKKKLCSLHQGFIYSINSQPGLTLEGEVGEEVAFWTFTSFYKSLRAKLKSLYKFEKSLCKFEKSLCEFVKSFESRCKFQYVEEIILKILQLGAEYCQFPFIFSEISAWKV